MSGLTSAAASGATTIAQLGFIRTDNSDGPQYMSIDGYDGVTPGVAECRGGTSDCGIGRALSGQYGRSGDACVR